MESGGKEENVRGGTVADASPNVVLMVGIDEGVTDGTDAKRAQDFVTGTADEQLGEKADTGPMDVSDLKNDDSCKLWRESTWEDNAEVRRLLSLAEGDDTRFEFEEQQRRPQMKIKYRGKPYNCTKCGNLSNTTTICCEMKRNYKCAMVRGRGANAEWRRDQEKRGARAKKRRRKKTRMIQSPLQKKGGGKRGFIEVCGNFKGYFSKQRATHILNH